MASSSKSKQVRLTFPKFKELLVSVIEKRGSIMLDAYAWVKQQVSIRITPLVTSFYGCEHILEARPPGIKLTHLKIKKSDLICDSASRG
jgi:hypothetical protein